jgi:hypothetical protein
VEVRTAEVERIAAEHTVARIGELAAVAVERIEEAAGRTGAVAAEEQRKPEAEPASAAADTAPATPEFEQDSGIALSEPATAADLPQPAPADRALGNPDTPCKTANSHVRNADTPN